MRNFPLLFSYLFGTKQNRLPRIVCAAAGSFIVWNGRGCFLLGAFFLFAGELFDQQIGYISQKLNAQIQQDRHKRHLPALIVAPVILRLCGGDHLHFDPALLGDEHLAGFAALERADDALFLHGVHQAGGAGVAEL